MFDKIKHFYRDLKKDTPILRCVFGVTFALVVSTSLGYITPHMTAIFVLMFLGPNMKPLGLKTEIGAILFFIFIGYFGILLGYYLIDYTLVILPILGLIVFWSLRLTKIPEPLRLLFLILAVLIPFICLNANLLGNVVLMALLLNLIVAMVVIRIAFFLFPVSKYDQIEVEAENATIYKNLNKDKLAFNGLLVLFPLILIFYLFNAFVALITLVYVILLCFDPFIYQSKKGAGIILANVIGGSIGIVAYNILVIAPSYLLYTFLVICVAFYFITNLYTGKKTAAVFRMGFNTFFVVMGTVSTSTNEAGDTIGERLLQIVLAVIYVMVAYKIVNTFNNPKIINE